MGSTLRYNTHQSAKTRIGKLSMHFTSAFVTLANSALPGLMPSWRIAYSPGEAFSIRGKGDKVNKQNPGIEWTHVFGRGTGYTWNPVGGCFHQCQWKMPDGSMAQCYAKSQAERQTSATFYPHGFEYDYWHPDRLNEPKKVKEPSGIFLDSMSDLMGHWVVDEHINQVLNVCRETPQHIYFLLTKNAPRLRQFEYPANVWVGVSMPPTFINGKRLTTTQQWTMLKVSLNALRATNARVKWLSAEPLSWDITKILDDDPYPKTLQWIVAGAASNGMRTFQPDPTWVKWLVEYCHEEKTPLFFKRNLSIEAGMKWHEEYPSIKPEAKAEQQLLF